jgi:hypothetical protein
MVAGSARPGKTLSIAKVTNMTPGRLWWFIRRDWKRGLPAAWNDYIVSRSILERRNPHMARSPNKVPLHFLTSN